MKKNQSNDDLDQNLTEYGDIFFIYENELYIVFVGILKVPNCVGNGL